MPRLGDANLEQHKVANFTYSAAKIEDLGASEFTLVCIVNDVSGSVASYKTDMEKTLQEIVKACDKSPRKDNLLIRHIQFADMGKFPQGNGIMETHGFKTLDTCKQADYDDCLDVGGCTALFDASRNAILATGDYAKKLTDQHFLCNAIVIIVTDAEDNASTCSADDVKKALAKIAKDESLESIVTILIGVGLGSGGYAQQVLDDFHKAAGFTQFIAQANADDKTLAKLAQFVSKSISSQSQAIGTGGPSQPVTF